MQTGQVAKNDSFVLFSMDCEPARIDVTPHGLRMSGSGPADYVESERSIRAYVTTVKAHGYPVTLFLHPEVAANQPRLVLELQEQGACLGLHLHPYKLGGGRYRYDLGAYSASEQRAMISKAVQVWERALGQRPRYFRGGYFSANDNTFGVLLELGFRGGSLSCPGRVLPQHFSVWAGTEHYPHRAHCSFRQQKGSSHFVEVPVAVDLNRPMRVGAAGEQGYEWPYIPARHYEHQQAIKGILARFRSDSPRYGTLVMDTHNDQDYADPDHPARLNLQLILDAIAADCLALDLRPQGVTLADLCDAILSEGP